MEGDSHIVTDGMLVIQSGQGTVEFPIDQVNQIRGLPSLQKAKPTSKAAAVKIENNPSSSDEILIRAALQEGLTPEFVRSVALVESSLRQNAISPKGAIGLMQLMPLTAGSLGVNPNLADENALGGAAFLRKLLIKYKGDSALALAAYNAGPGSVDKYKGVPPFLETHRYIVKVLQEYARQQRLRNEKQLSVASANPLSVVR